MRILETKPSEVSYQRFKKKKLLSWREIHYSAGITEYLRRPSSSRSTDCWVCPRTIWSDFIYRSRMPDRASGWSLQIISADGAASAIVQEGQHPAHPPLGHGAPWLTFNQNCETSTRNSSHFSPFSLHRSSFLVLSSDGIRRIKFENVFYLAIFTDITEIKVILVKLCHFTNWFVIDLRFVVIFQRFEEKFLFRWIDSKWKHYDSGRIK